MVVADQVAGQDCIRTAQEQATTITGRRGIAAGNIDRVPADDVVSDGGIRIPDCQPAAVGGAALPGLVIDDRVADQCRIRVVQIDAAAGVFRKVVPDDAVTDGRVRAVDVEAAAAV